MGPAHRLRPGGCLRRGVPRGSGPDPAGGRHHVALLFQPANRDRLAVRGFVRGRSPTRWTLELGEGEEPGSWRTLATGGTTGRRSKRLATVDPRRLAAGGHTLRLRATDSNGNTGEDRAFFFACATACSSAATRSAWAAQARPRPSWPISTATVGRRSCSPPQRWRVTVLSGRTGRRFRGWPKAMRSYGTRVARRRLGTLRQGFLGTPAVGNIAGGPRMEIVAAGSTGACTPGPRAAGGCAASRCASTCTGRRATAGATRRSTPAPPWPTWNGDGGSTSWWARPTRRSTPGTAAAGACRAGPCSPATPPAATWRRSSPPRRWGDLNGDGSPDVVEGTAEAYGSTPSTTGRVYAFSARGKLLPGWPVKPEALSADGIPLAGEGVPMSPSLADVDGDGRDEVAVAAFTGQPELYRGDGTRMSRPGRATTSNPSAAAALRRPARRRAWP